MHQVLGWVVGFWEMLQWGTQYCMGPLSSLPWTIFSWNCRGVNEQIKRGKGVKHSDIMFYRKLISGMTFSCRCTGHVYHCKFNTKARGTALLIYRRVTTHNKTIADNEWRFVIVVEEMFSISLTLVNIYGPSFDNPQFFGKAQDLIPNISQTKLLS